jgi:hypothetical protein
MKNLVLIGFVLVHFTSFGQSKKALAKEHARNLKNGALLVRLYTATNKTNALLVRGREEDAVQTQRDQYYINREMYVAFKAAYKFSPVYFFYNTDSDKVRRGEFDGILLNERLFPDSTIKINPSYYYIAEMDNTPGTGMYALVIKNKDFEFLEKPFPYYVKRFDVFPYFRRNKVQMVKKLNKKLKKLN